MQTLSHGRLLSAPLGVDRRDFERHFGLTVRGSARFPRRPAARRGNRGVPCFGEPKLEVVLRISETVCQSRRELLPWRV